MNVENENENINGNENVYDDVGSSASKDDTTFNAISALNLNKYTNSIFNFYANIGINNKIFKKCDKLFYIIEVIQIFIIFFNNNNAFEIPSKISTLLNLPILKFSYKNSNIIINIISWILLIIIYGCFCIFGFGSANSFKKVPEWVIKMNAYISKIMFGPLFVPFVFNFLDFLVNKNSDDDDTDKDGKGFLIFCYTESILGLILLYLHSLLSSLYMTDYIPLTNTVKEMTSASVQNMQNLIVIAEILNGNLLYNKLGYETASLIISVVFLLGMWLFYIKRQSYYSMRLNNMHAALYFSFFLLNLEILLFYIMDLNDNELIYIAYLDSEVIFFIIGWYVNIIIQKRNIDKIVRKIQKKYNQQNVIKQLKEQLEEENSQEFEKKSLETVVTEKNIKKKDKSFNNYIEASFLCKFIMYNRSPDSFTLVQKIFNECINQFPREPYAYIDYWNHLHGIRLFISRNKEFFSDYSLIIEQINLLSVKVLSRVSNLDINLKTKFLIYFAQYNYEVNKSTFINIINNNHDHKSNGKDDFNLGFDTDIVKNAAVGYHIKSINSFKTLVNELKNSSTTGDTDRIFGLNEDLAKVILKANKYYNVYINKFSYSKEALKLYSMFLRDILNKTDMANEFLKNLDDNEIEDNNNNRPLAYEKSEGLSSMTSTGEAKRNKILKVNMKNKFQKPLYNLFYLMQASLLLFVLLGIYCNRKNKDVYKNVTKGVSGINIGFQSPYVVSRIKYDLRLASLGLSADDQEVIDEYMSDLKTNVEFLEKTYIPFIYLRHSSRKLGLYTTKIITDHSILETINENYFLNIMRIQKNARLFIDKFNKTSTDKVFNMGEEVPCYFKENTIYKFGPVFLKAIDLVVADNKKKLNKELEFVYIIIGCTVVIEIIIIFGGIIK